MLIDDSVKNTRTTYVNNSTLIYGIGDYPRVVDGVFQSNPHFVEKKNFNFTLLNLTQKNRLLLFLKRG